MKTLDRYIARNFIVGYLISFSVLMGLCIVVDVFVNVDEWAENVDRGLLPLVIRLGQFYGSRVALWFRDMAGMVTVIAAVFSLTRMTRNNELIAVMASGVSLKRIIAPILFLALFLTGLQVIDQELIIPRLAQQLTYTHDYVPGQRRYRMWFASDSFGHLISTPSYHEENQTMDHPFFVLRWKDPETQRWVVTGQVQAQSAQYDYDRKGWILQDGRRLDFKVEDDRFAGNELGPVEFIQSDLDPVQVPLRHQKGFVSLLSSMQVENLIRSPGTRPTDLAELYLQKHVRITDPLINLIMLMVALPVLVCRDPRDMKSAIMTSFMITSACFITTFLCKLFATEVFFHQVRPELWAWLPVFIFLPIAFLQIDSMKT